MSPRSENVDASAHESAKGRRPNPDSFDKPGKSRRVGVHRAPKRVTSAWINVLWIALATMALTALGIIFVVIGPENLLFPQSTDQSQQATTPTEKAVKGKTDPATTITVLNGTDTAGLGDEVAATITDDQLGTVTFVGNAADQTATISAVFYGDKADEALAKGLGDKLGGIFYYYKEEYASFGTQLVVLIGSDYVGTGSPSGASSGSSSTPSATSNSAE